MVAFALATLTRLRLPHAPRSKVDAWTRTSQVICSSSLVRIRSNVELTLS